MSTATPSDTIDVAELYRSYGPMVLRRCQRMLRNEADAADAMQETFVKLVSKAASLDRRAPSSLLYTMATRVCLNRLRSHKRRPEDRDDELLMRIAATESDAEAQSVARNMLHRIFKREQPSTQTIAVLHLLDGLTLEEVAAEVGLSVSGVRKRIRTMRARLPELEAA